MAAANELETALRLDDPANVELDRLNVAVDAGWFQASLLELRCDVLRRLSMFRTAGLSSLHAIVRQRLDVRPPVPAVGVRSRQRCDGDQGYQAGGGNVLHGSFFFTTPC